MEIEVIMPKLGLTMEEGTIVRWLKRAGDVVKSGDIIFEVETDKSIQEVETPGEGVLAEILVEEGLTVLVATPVARIRASGEPMPISTRLSESPSAVSQSIPSIVKGEEIPNRDTGASVADFELQGKEGEARYFVSWRARRIALELGVDLRKMGRGSGPQGRIIEQDVLREAGNSRHVGEEQWIELTRIQKITAERMALSFSSIPHFYLTTEVNAESLLRLRDELLLETEHAAMAGLTISDLLIKLTAIALEKHPRVNAAWLDGRLQVNNSVNIGLAVAGSQGLLVPVICHAAQKSISEIAAIRSRLVSKAQAGRLEPCEMSDGSFTLTNLGMYGVDQFQAIINPPQSVILAVGRIKERPVAKDGQVALMPTFFLTLSCDHRVLDGVSGAAFLQDVVELIENPRNIVRPEIVY